MRKTIMKFDTLEEAREYFKKNGFDKGTPGPFPYPYAIVKIKGQKTLLAKTDAFMDVVWNDMVYQLKRFGQCLTPGYNLTHGFLVEEASSLRDEFLNSIKKVYKLSYATVYEEF